jgi:hypothetical protein
MQARDCQLPRVPERALHAAKHTVADISGITIAYYEHMFNMIFGHPVASIDGCAVIDPPAIVTSWAAGLPVVGLDYSPRSPQ